MAGAEMDILVVDDQPVNLRLLRAQLEAAGHRVVEATNGVEALARLDQIPVDLVITDILMPVMDGYRLCYEIRRSARHSDLPIVVYTASYVSPSDEKLSLDLGADRYLRKPAPAEEILRAVEEARSDPRRPRTTVFAASDVLQQYSQRLVEKLEKKNIELTETAGRLQLQRIALETAADAILIADAAGTILWVNPAFTVTTGFTAEEAIGRTPAILKSGLHDEAFYRKFWETIRAGKTWRSEFTNRRKDGTIYYDEHTITPVRGEDGAISHYVGVMHDVTDRKRAEERLREANARLRQILDHSPAVLYALDVDGEKLSPRLVSENVRNLLGFEVAETMRPDWWSEQLHPDDRARALDSVAETMKRGSSRTEYRIRRRDEGYRWVEDSRQLIRDDRGRPVELVGVWVDVTERRRAEDQLQESERRFREMLNNLDLVAMMLDRQARITYCNDYLLRLTGWLRTELIGRSWHDVFIPAEMQDEMQGVFDSLLDGAPEAWHHENEILLRSGRRRTIHWNNSLMRSASGEVIGTASIGEDVTALRDHEHHMMRTQRLESLGTLAGGIAHDLNNLLMPIMMGATLLRRLTDDERTLKAVENIERSVNRGRNLVSQVLLFARGGDATSEQVDIAHVVNETASIAGSTFPKNISIEVSLPPRLPVVSADPTQLTQVLLNLCVNARDAMTQGGHLTISARSISLSEDEARLLDDGEVGAYVLLEVSDEGEGIQPSMVERIFDPFFTTKPSGQGTGLGLSTVQGIVRKLGGFVRVESTPGEGSTFQVYLPAIPGDATPAETEESEPVPPVGSGQTILTVDDDAAVLDMTRLTLETFGYRVLSAVDGAEAIAVYAGAQPNVALLLTDISMPVLDGAALIAALKRINPSLRVIATSGSPSAGSAARLRKLGAMRLLTKPYSAEHLLRAVAEVLSAPAV